MALALSTLFKVYSTVTVSQWQCQWQLTADSGSGNITRSWFVGVVPVVDFLTSKMSSKTRTKRNLTPTVFPVAAKRMTQDTNITKGAKMMERTEIIVRASAISNTDLMASFQNGVKVSGLLWKQERDDPVYEHSMGFSWERGRGPKSSLNLLCLFRWLLLICFLSLV